MRQVVVLEPAGNVLVIRQTSLQTPVEDGISNINVTGVTTTATSSIISSLIQRQQQRKLADENMVFKGLRICRQSRSE